RRHRSRGVRSLAPPSGQAKREHGGSRIEPPARDAGALWTSRGARAPRAVALGIRLLLASLDRRRPIRTSSPRGATPAGAPRGGRSLRTGRRSLLGACGSSAGLSPSLLGPRALRFLGRTSARFGGDPTLA